MQIETLGSVFFFILGSIVGSFLNVLIIKYNTGRSAGGRSACMSCLRQLAWYELVPVLSFILLRGRCRTCTSRLSLQYPLVELSAGILFLLVYLQNLPLVVMLFAFLISILFLFIVVYDLKHMIIPEAPMYMLIGLSLVSQVVNPTSLALQVPNWWDFSMGPALFAFFASLFIITKGRGVGFGDAKLALAIGFLLGFPESISAFLLAFWIGAAVGVTLLVWSHIVRRLGYKRMFYPIRKLLVSIFKKIPIIGAYMGKASSADLSNGVYFLYVPQSLWHGKSEIPFAPFLAFGTFLVFFFDVSVLFL